MEEKYMDYSKTLNSIIKDVNQIMRTHPKRLLHIQGVAMCMESFAKHYHLDVEKALVIAYLHDITKKESDRWHLENSYPTYQSIFKNYPYYSHALSAAFVAKEKYEIKEASILNAITYHCTGYDELDIYAKLLIIADVCEPSRKHGDTTMLYQRALHDLEVAYKMAFEIKYQTHINENQTIHPWFIKAKEKIEENHVIKNKNNY